MSRQIRLSQGFLTPTLILSLFSDIWSCLTASGLKKSAVLKSCPNSAEAQSAAEETACTYLPRQQGTPAQNETRPHEHYLMNFVRRPSVRPVVQGDSNDHCGHELQSDSGKTG